MNNKLTTFESLLEHQEVVMSEYGGFSSTKYRRPFTDAMVTSLLQHRLIERTEHLEVDGANHCFHFYLLGGSAAIIYRGADDILLEKPILCRCAEALCYELLEWRSNVGLQPVEKVYEVKNSRIPTDEDLDNIDETCIEHRMEAVFIDQIQTLCNTLEAVALSEA